MTAAPHLLLLAGSFEARRLALGLEAAGVPYTAVLSEAPRGPARMPQTPLLRRFDSGAAMATWVGGHGFTAVLDASHAFDRTLTHQAHHAAAHYGLPYLRLERPAWRLEAPNWRSAPTVAAAMDGFGPGARVFAATGWDSLPQMAAFAGAALLLRQTRRHDRPAPYPFVELVFGDPPFDAAAERALFTSLSVDALMCRNLGGRASRPKLDAALALDIPVVLIDRPALPTGISLVSDIDAALAWVGGE